MRIELPLAHTYDGPHRLAEGNWVVQPKLDGVRCLNTPIGLISRSGKPLKLPVPLSSIPLDGEIVCYNEEGEIDFQLMQKNLQRKDGMVFGTFQFIAFDLYLPRSTKTYEERWSEITHFPRIENWPLAAYTPDQWLAVMEERGHEGVMFRRLDAPVTAGRSFNLLKYKQFHDEEFEVTGVIEGEGKHKERMGALVCGEFNVGTGFTDEQREKWFKNPPKQITVKYQEKTDRGVPRFPSFLKVHE